MFKEFSLFQTGYQVAEDSDLGWLLARRKLWKIVKDTTEEPGVLQSMGSQTVGRLNNSWVGEVVVLTRQSIFKFQ